MIGKERRSEEPFHEVRLFLEDMKELFIDQEPGSDRIVSGRDSCRVTSGSTNGTRSSR
jgi:hypothetical protein